MKQTIYFLFCVGVLSRGFCGSITEKQSDTESQFFGSLVRAVGLYQAAHQGVLPANWTMLREVFSEEGWNMWEQKFRKFGDKKGFTNSIFEKYVFVKPGVIVVTTQPPKEIFLMSSSPVQEGATLARRAILIEGTNVVERHIPEDFVQKSFKLAGREIPTPPPIISGIDPAEKTAKLEVRPTPEDSSQFQNEHRESVDNQMTSPLRLNSTNETVTVTPTPKQKSWWPVFIVLGIGLVFLLALKQRRKK